MSGIRNMKAFIVIDVNLEVAPMFGIKSNQDSINVEEVKVMASTLEFHMMNIIESMTVHQMVDNVHRLI